MDVSKETQEKIGKLQMMEQNLQGLLVQKQQLQTQIFELENALKEMDTSEVVYKVIGSMMVLSKKDVLKKELEEKKEFVVVRLQSVEKQENQLKDKAKKLQEEVLSSLKK